MRLEVGSPPNGTGRRVHESDMNVVWQETFVGRLIHAGERRLEAATEREMREVVGGGERNGIGGSEARGQFRRKNGEKARRPFGTEVD